MGDKDGGWGVVRKSGVSFFTLSFRGVLTDLDSVGMVGAPLFTDKV